MYLVFDWGKPIRHPGCIRQDQCHTDLQLYVPDADSSYTYRSGNERVDVGISAVAGCLEGRATGTHEEQWRDNAPKPGSPRAGLSVTRSLNFAIV